MDWISSLLQRPEYAHFRPLPDSTVRVPKGAPQPGVPSQLAHRNNNPGNLEFAGQAGAVRGDKGFAKFATPADGYRALLAQVAKDQGRDMTLEQFITKYAPPSQNDTATYIAQAAKALGVRPSDSVRGVAPGALSSFVANKESGTAVPKEFGLQVGALPAPPAAASSTATPGRRESLWRRNLADLPIPTVGEGRIFTRNEQRQNAATMRDEATRTAGPRGFLRGESPAGMAAAAVPILGDAIGAAQAGYRGASDLQDKSFGVGNVADIALSSLLPFGPAAKKALGGRRMMRLSHFSEKEGLSLIDPAFAGTNEKIRGAERAQGAKVMHYFDETTNPKYHTRYEDGFGRPGQTKYESQVPFDKIYDFHTDDLKLKGFTDKLIAKGMDPVEARAALHQTLDDNGFIGYTRRDGLGTAKRTVAIFKPLVPKGAVAAELAKRADGFTYDIGTSTFADRGVATAVGGSAPKLITTGAPSQKELDAFIRANPDWVAKGGSLGGWLDKDSGKFYTEFAKVHPDRDAALAHMKRFNEKAGFDLGKGEEFPNPDFRDGDAGGLTATVPPPAAPAVKAPLPPLSDGNQTDPGVVSRGLSRTVRATLRDPQRAAFPGIYGDPREIVREATANVAPESPALKELFGIDRHDLFAQSKTPATAKGVLPSATANPRGSAAAGKIMTRRNENRILSLLDEANNSEPLATGMRAWYEMDPAYQRLVEIWGPDEAARRYERLNTLTGMSSPGSDVVTELDRGTHANMMDRLGQFREFKLYGGGMAGGEIDPRAPSIMRGILGHPYHPTAQAIPMEQYLETGASQMASPKVPPYIGASNARALGKQLDIPVGDAHWSRGVGLADVRTNQNYGASVSTAEMQQLAPWWRNKIAGNLFMDAVPAQGLLWGTLGKQTGVKTMVGAPKLEIMADGIMRTARNLEIDPALARDMILSGDLAIDQAHLPPNFKGILGRYY